MQPYQTGAEENIRQAKMPFKIAGKGMQAAFSLLSPYIKSNLAARGLSRVNPKIGSFIKKAVAAGFTEEEAIENIREKADQFQEEEKQKPKSIFDEFLGGVEVETLPEEKQRQLSFLRSASGQLEAKGLNAKNPGFSKIRKSVQDVLNDRTGMIVGEAMSSPLANQNFQRESKNAFQQEGQMSAPIDQGQQSQQQAGPGEQALMKILAEIQQMRGSQ